MLLYLFENQWVTEVVLKGALLRCKRAPFTHQKGIFYHVKGRLLEGKRASIKLRVRIILTKGRHKLCFKIFPTVHQAMVTVPVEEVQI